MYTLLGLAMFTAQVWGAVILFGGHQSAPQWLKIAIGVFLLLSLIAMFSLAYEA